MSDRRLLVSIVGDAELALYRLSLYGGEIENLAEIVEKRIESLETAARNLIADVRRRYPGEELRCPYMRALDEALV